MVMSSEKLNITIPVLEEGFRRDSLSIAMDRRKKHGNVL